MNYNSILRDFKIWLKLRDRQDSGFTMGSEETRFAEYQLSSTVLRKSFRTESKILSKCFRKPIKLMIVLKRRFIIRNSTKLYLLAACGYFLTCHVTNATPTVKINSTKYTRNDSANSIDGDTIETPTVERHKKACV